MSNIIAAEFLTPSHFSKFPVWQYINDDALGETMTRPVKSLPVQDLSSCIVGCKVQLADGTPVWAALTNVDVRNPLSTEQFMSVDIFMNDQCFHLARYHDVFFHRSGPEQLAQFLGKKLEDVFPISYDLSLFSYGDPSALKGNVYSIPSQRLSREQLRRLALRGMLD